MLYLEKPEVLLTVKASFYNIFIYFIFYFCKIHCSGAPTKKREKIERVNELLI